MKNLIFKYKITTAGDLLSSFVFTDLESVNAWINEDFAVLKGKYKTLTCIIRPIDGLKLGDTCRVYGEGEETFKILDIKTYSDNRYGFLLDSGWFEEVAKCYKP